MKITTREFENKLNNENFRYEILTEGASGEPDCVMVTSSADNMHSISIQFFFSDNDVGIRVFSIATVPENKREAVLNELNEITCKYRWVNFSIDKDNEVIAAIDAIIDYDSAAEVCYELMFKMYNIVDDMYPKIMKQLW